MSSNNHIKHIAQKVLLSTATPEEQEELQRYLASADEEETKHLLFDQDANTSPNPTAEGSPIVLSRHEKDQMLSNILGKTTTTLSAATATRSGAPQPTATLPHRRFRTWYAAASFFLLLGSGLTFWLTSRHGRPKELAFRESRTPNGQHRLVVLPDGTKVYLNAGTILRYPEQYSDTTREVFLNGEAFFDVAQEKQRPFIVKAAHFSAMVLGTSFDLRDYADERSSCVQLKTGRLQVTVDSKQVVLSPRQQVTYRTDSPGMAMTSVSTDDIGSWTTGRLIFNDRSSLGILKELERTYNIHFRVHVGSTALTRRYTVRCDKMSLDKTLATVGLLTGLELVRKDSTIEVYSQQPGRP